MDGCALIPPQGALTAGCMVHRILAILPLVLLCACAMHQLSAREPLSPKIKPLTVEQEEQVRASGVR